MSTLPPRLRQRRRVLTLTGVSLRLQRASIEAAVKAAKKEIKRILDEASVDAAPDASSRYSKYSI